MWIWRDEYDRLQMRLRDAEVDVVRLSEQAIGLAKFALHQQEQIESHKKWIRTQDEQVNRWSTTVTIHWGNWVVNTISVRNLRVGAST